MTRKSAGARLRMLLVRPAAPSSRRAGRRNGGRAPLPRTRPSSADSGPGRAGRITWPNGRTTPSTGRRVWPRPGTSRGLARALSRGRTRAGTSGSSGALDVRDRGRSAERPLEVGRNELDVGERLERGEPARNLRNKGRRGAGERSGREVWFRFLDGREREPLAFRWRRRGLFRPRIGLPQRSLEMGRDELDLGERVELSVAGRNVWHEGCGGAGERSGREVWFRLLDGRERELLAVRRLRRGFLRLRNGHPQRSLEVGRDELDLGQRVRLVGPARNVRDEGRRGAGERPGGEERCRLVVGRERQPVALRRPRPLSHRVGETSTTSGSGTERTGRG